MLDGGDRLLAGALAVTLGLWSCATPSGQGQSRPPAQPDSSTVHPVASASLLEPTSASSTPAQTPTPEEKPPVPLPENLRPGEIVRVPLPQYRAAFVAHGNPGTRRALIYLHGICGDIHKVSDWSVEASEYVTTIALYGNSPCPDTPNRFSWNQDITFIHELIQTALVRVAEQRDGQLDVAQVVLFGYSQGAHRAERLAERYPEHYPWLILGGPPTTPTIEHLHKIRRAVILVGSEERHELPSAAAAALSAQGVPTSFDVFPGAGHGSFGPRSPEVMSRALRWLLDP